MSDFGSLRVSSHEHELRLLMEKYPKLSRTEVIQAIEHHGPMRGAVEMELDRVSELKR